MTHKQKRHPGEGGAVLLLAGVEQSLSTENRPALQPATVHQVRALHLIARHHARPELALALAALAYGEAR